MAGLEELFVEKEVRDPNYEGWKKLYETNPDAAEMNENHAEYLERYTLEMSTSNASELPAEEIIETAEVTEEQNPLLNLFQQNNSLNNDQAITTLFTEQEPQGIMAANGGRIALRGGGMDMGNASNQAQSASMGNTSSNTSSNNTSSNTDNSSGNDNNYTYKGPADLGVTTRTVNKVTAPEAKEYIGGKAYDVTPDTKDERDNARNVVKKAAVETIKTNKINNVNKLTNDNIPKKSWWKKAGGLLFDATLFVASGSSSKLISNAAKIGSTYKKAKMVKGLVEDALVQKKPKEGEEPKTWKTATKNVLTKKAKEEIVKKINKADIPMSVKELDLITDVAKDAWNSDIAKSIKNKFVDNIPKSIKNNKKAPTTYDDLFNQIETKKKPITTLYNRNDNSNEGGGSTPPVYSVDPIIPTEENTILLTEPESSLSDMATLDLNLLNFIRNRQNRRRSFFNANRGGLAGLFRVKNQ